jgi:hypothetical protein
LNRSISGSFGGPVSIPEAPETDTTNGDAAFAGRPRSTTATSLGGVKEDEDEDRVDAKNAASRLAQSTF